MKYFISTLKYHNKLFSLLIFFRKIKKFELLIINLLIYFFINKHNFYLVLLKYHMNPI